MPNPWEAGEKYEKVHVLAEAQLTLGFFNWSVTTLVPSASAVWLQAASLEQGLASTRIFWKIWVADLAWVLRGKGALPTRPCGALAVRKRCVPLRFGAVCAGVLLEAVLSDPVKCKRGKGALKARGYKTPTAVRAAPACESFILSPNHASRHECTS